MKPHFRNLSFSNSGKLGQRQSRGGSKKTATVSEQTAFLLQTGMLFPQIHPAAQCVLSSFYILSTILGIGVEEKNKQTVILAWRGQPHPAFPHGLHSLLEAFSKYCCLQESLWRLLQCAVYVTHNLFFDNGEQISIYYVKYKQINVHQLDPKAKSFEKYVFIFTFTDYDICYIDSV